MPAPLPFTAVIGQSPMKLALLLCLVNPKIGGVLLSGGRGSAKSTLVRGLPPLKPGMNLVNLPLGASEEMVTGSLNLEQAMQQGEVAFTPGLLARAHKGLLYVDEVNLLPDHLVDLLLDVAASGINQVERDAISHQHPSEFTLVGTMNPDEGELRPQLLDRFGLMAAVQSSFSTVERQKIVEQQMLFDRQPESLVQQQAEQTKSLEKQIAQAIKLLSDVTTPEAIKVEIAQRCANANVEGMRADITFYRAAAAHAALDNRTRVELADLCAVDDLVLSHRRRETPPSGQSAGRGPANGGNTPDTQNENGQSSIQGSWGAMNAEAIASSEPLQLEIDPAVTTKVQVSDSQWHSQKSNSKQAGTYSARQSVSRNSDIGKPDWLRTLSAMENILARNTGSGKQKLFRRHPLRKSIELDIILLDTSASTLGGNGLSLAKGAIRSLSLKAYQSRRQLALLTFGNNRVETVLTPQRAPKNIEPMLVSITGGGGTPLEQGLSVVQTLIAKNAKGRYAMSLIDND